ncbi:hypothetical protein K227x_26420 [Rubripirellula lacrimiformis]|uniref:Uncharacterized protein n=1 Tax=Rubripirellula lacrimiformis TaxID=1930273 RepID=A0A517NAU3_9BACT|nr:hypothetical protein [Rubripirellula lacrimiformis]QDT04252.1 hypothetical protein K227x_26420 [Rubripirellula lacrimiformis]
MKTNIEMRALKSLVSWKSLFAEEVTAEAKLLASQGAAPETVTLDDYQRAAPIAAATLLERIASETTASADSKDV